LVLTPWQAESTLTASAFPWGEIMRVPALGFLFLVSLPFVLRAQSTNASLTGRVTDPSKAFIADARVAAISASTNFRYETTTNNSGEYYLTNLPPGIYRLEIEKPGFKKTIKPDVVLHVQDAIELDFELTLGSATETITVESGAPLLNTESAAVGTVVDRQFVENLPLNGRSFQSLITLAPGVVLTKANEDDAGQFSVNGQRPDANYFTVDGVSANFAAVADTVLGQVAGGTLPATTVVGGLNNLVSIDALQEFKILTSTYAAEFGRVPGGQVLIVTRSGTNQFHGMAFDYFRNDVMDANDWFANAKGLPKPAEKQNDFGGVFGGPILRNRTFFFFSYEGLRLRQPVTSFTQVPSVASRTSALLPANIRPFLDAFPLPNGADTTNGLALFSASYSNPTSLDATSIRIDQKVGDKFTIFGRYNYAPSSLTARGAFGAALSGLTHINLKTQTLTIGATAGISRNLVNDLRFNWSRNDATTRRSLDDFDGAVPVPLSQFFPQSFGSVSPVTFVFSVGGVFVQDSKGTPDDNPQRQLNVIDSLSFAKGSHQLKFGIDYRRLFPEFNVLRFNGTAIFNSAAAADTGKINSGQLIAVAPPRFPVFVSTSTYGQDTWAITRRLTLTYGLRWEINFYPKENNGLNPLTVTGLDNPASIAFAPQGTPLWHTTYGNFAPRVGLAYQLSEKQNLQTVLRGGFGVYYDLGWGGQLQAFASSWPFTVRKFLPAGTAFPYDGTVTTPSLTNPTLPATTLIVTVPDLKLPYTYEWNFTVEQALGSNQSLTASYVGAVGRHLLRQELLSNPNPDFVSLFVTTNLATSDYHALQLQFQRRLSKGLQALASYTWSHSIDTASTDEGFGASPPAANVNPQVDRSSSDFDVRHAFNGAVTYNIPSPFAHGFGKAVLGDWAVDTIVTARSATPVNVLVSSSANLSFGGSLALRPDVIPGVPLYLDDPTVAGGRRFNSAALTPGPTNRQGTLPRNAFRGFPIRQVDLAIRRQFELSERIRLQFRTEFFNILNHPNFADPGNFQGNILSNALFGQSTQMFGRGLTNPGGGSGGFNPLYQIGGPRSIQLALKLQF
jgi:Carboxypeptidase regulatory-like domain